MSNVIESLEHIIEPHNEYVVVFNNNVLDDTSHHYVERVIFSDRVPLELVECWVFDIQHTSWHHCTALWSQGLEDSLREFVNSSTYKEGQLLISRTIFNWNPLVRGMSWDFFARCNIPMVDDLHFNSQEFKCYLQDNYNIISKEQCCSLDTLSELAKLKR